MPNLQEQYHSIGNYYNAKERYPLYDGDDLGAVYTPKQTVFKVWAPSASAVTLNIYRTGSDVEPEPGRMLTAVMTKNPHNGVWSVAIDSDLSRLYYTYRVTVDGVTQETQDVYSKAVGVNGHRSMILDMKTTNPAGWENDKHVFVDKPTDAVIWEVHVRDFSISKTSGVDNEKRGKYLAFTQRGTTEKGGHSTCVEYLVEQGINYVHLNPVFDFGSIDEAMQTTQYNWGYDPVNFNVPEGSYATSAADGSVRIKEFKKMVQALHERGIGVIMDVVYNHLYSANDSCFEKTVPGYYFRMYSRHQFFNGSGCGNVTASDKAMFRKFMIDSLIYWVKEYHIDGFRFDLMGCHDYITMNQIREALDKIDKRIIMYGEPWMADWMSNGIDGQYACTTQNAFKLNSRIGMFSDKMRNALKGNTDDESVGYIQGATNVTNDIKAGMMGGASDTFGRWTKAPTQCVTYDSAHDNLTLWDKILKSNGNNDFNGHNSVVLAQNKLSAVITLTSQGIPFFLAGEEFGRTKYGDHNSYRSADSVNRIDWARIHRYNNLVEYYKGLIALRRAYSPFRAGDHSTANHSYFFENGSAIGYTLKNTTDNAENEWGIVAILVNNSAVSKMLDIKVNGEETPDTWVVVVNGEHAGIEKLGTVHGKSINVPPRSALVLVDSQSFERLKAQDRGYRTVTVKHIDKESDTVIKEISSHFLVGANYQTMPYKSMLFDYTVVNSSENTKGIMGQENIEVKYFYQKDRTEIYYLYRHYITEDGTPIKEPEVHQYKKGSSYSLYPEAIPGYELDTDHLPKDIIGKLYKDTEVTYVEKPLPNSSLKVHYYNHNNWITPHIYVYDERGGSAKTLTGQWPGAVMYAEGNEGWWTFDAIDVDEAQVMFNDGIFGQDPEPSHPGYTVNGEVWIEHQKVYFNSKVVVSHIDIEGHKLIEDTVLEAPRRTNEQTYRATSKSDELGDVVDDRGDRGEVSGAWSSKVQNVIFIHNPKKKSQDMNNTTSW